MSSNNVVSVPTKTKPHVVFTDSTEADNLLAFKHIEKRIRGNCPTLTALHVVIEIIFVDLVTEVYAYGDHDSNRHKRLVVRISCDLKQHCKYIVDVYADEKGRGKNTVVYARCMVWVSRDGDAGIRGEFGGEKGGKDSSGVVYLVVIFHV